MDALCLCVRCTYRGRARGSRSGVLRGVGVDEILVPVTRITVIGRIRFDRAATDEIADPASTRSGRIVVLGGQAGRRSGCSTLPALGRDGLGRPARSTAGRHRPAPQSLAADPGMPTASVAAYGTGWSILGWCSSWVQACWGSCSTGSSARVDPWPWVATVATAAFVTVLASEIIGRSLLRLDNQDRELTPQALTSPPQPGGCCPRRSGAIPQTVAGACEGPSDVAGAARPGSRPRSLRFGEAGDPVGGGGEQNPVSLTGRRPPRGRWPGGSCRCRVVRSGRRCGARPRRHRRPVHGWGCGRWAVGRRRSLEDLDRGHPGG